MYQDDEKTVTLTEAEAVIADWLSALLDEGYGLYEAADYIRESVPVTGLTYRTLNDTEFFYWLVDGSRPKPEQPK